VRFSVPLPLLLIEEEIEADFEIGEEVSEEVKLIDLGRRAILALRQNLISKIHEHDNTNLYKQFKDLIGEIYTAEVHHVRPRVVILVDDEGNEIVLPKEKTNSFPGDNVVEFIESVELKGISLKLLCLELREVFREII
jgi:N utilization substance protein A